MPDASSDTDTTADLVDVRSEGRLIVNLDFHKRAIAKKEKRLLRAKRNLNQMQRKVWRLEKVVSKGNSSASDDSSMLESDASGPVEFSTPQPSSSRAQRHTPLQTLHRSFAAVNMDTTPGTASVEIEGELDSGTKRKRESTSSPSGSKGRKVEQLVDTIDNEMIVSELGGAALFVISCLDEMV